MRTLLLTVTLAVTITGCSHDDLPDPPGTTLSRVDYDMGGTVVSETLTYDSQNRLIQVATNTTAFDLIYNLQGQLSGAILKDIASGAVIHSSHFTRDANGRIIKRTRVNAASTTTDRYYRYDDSGKMIADSLYNGIMSVVRLYTYNDRGNVVKMETIGYTGGVPASIRVWTCRYDDKLTPYHKVRDVLFYLIDMDFSLYLSASNITGSNIDGVESGRTYNYDYYSNGLPRSVVQNDSSPFRQLQKIVYTYVQP